MSKHIVFPPELMRAMFNAGMTGQPMGISAGALVSALRRRPKATTSNAQYITAAPRRESTSKPKPKEPPTSAELRERWQRLMAAPTKAPWL